MKHKVTHKFYLPETGEIVDELPPERHKLFLEQLIKEPIQWMIEAKREEARHKAKAVGDNCGS